MYIIRMKGGADMNIGDRIVGHFETQIDNIVYVVPVQYKDDGEMQWYEVCDASQTDLVAIIGQSTNEDGETVDIINVIKKTSVNIDMLTDLL